MCAAREVQMEGTAAASAHLMNQRHPGKPTGQASPAEGGVAGCVRAAGARVMTWLAPAAPSTHRRR